MKYFFAFLIAVVLIVGMFVFQSQMAAQMAAWERADASLSALQQLLGYAAKAIAAYWYLFASLIAIICLAVATLIPQRGSEGRSTS